MATEEDFQKALKFTLSWEGGAKVTNDPSDPGGLTKYGIALSQHSEMTRDDILNLTEAKAGEIYRSKYWDAVSADKQEWPLCAISFDTAVNLGVSRTIGYLQAPMPGGAIKTTNGVALNVLNMRIAHYKKRVIDKPSQQKYFNGWMNRINALKILCSI